MRRFFLLALCVAPLFLFGQLPPGIDYEVLAHHLRVPWDMDLDHEGNIWFTERDGTISRLNPFTGDLKLIHWEEDTFETPENSGMHALSLHPQFAQNGWIYVHTCVDKFGAWLYRYRFDFTNEVLTDREELIRFSANSSHNGSRIVWDSPTTFFMTMGDAYTRLRFPQDTMAINGKVLHFDQDAKPAEGNPMADSPVWSIGHRNPQGITMAPDGQVVVVEHGPEAYDEINIIERFRNYGWPRVLGYCDTPEEAGACDSLDVVEPWDVWDPTQAPSAVAYYGRDELPFEGSLLVSMLKAHRLEQVDFSTKAHTVWLEEEFGRLRDVLVAPDGSLLLCTSNCEIVAGASHRELDDRIIRLYNPEHHSPWRTSAWDIHAEGEVRDAGNGAVWAASYARESKLTLTIYDASGATALGPQALDGVFFVDQTELSAGVYHVLITDQGDQTVDFKRVLLRER